MGLIEAVIIGAAVFFGLSQIAEALDNVAVGIEQHGINITETFAGPEE